jgi:hypothetical protein
MALSFAPVLPFITHPERFAAMTTVFSRYGAFFFPGASLWQRPPRYTL